MFGKGLLTGMGVTWKHFWGKKETFCYPEEKLPVLDNFRGGNLAMDWRVCIACSLCSQACPNKAIKLTIVPDAKKKRHMKNYVHFSGRCLYCNLCVEVCPVHTLHWDKDFAIASYDKAAMTHDAMTDKDRADLADFLEEVKVKAAKEEAEKKAEAEAEAKAKAEAEAEEKAEGKTEEKPEAADAKPAAKTVAKPEPAAKAEPEPAKAEKDAKGGKG